MNPKYRNIIVFHIQVGYLCIRFNIGNYRGTYYLGMQSCHSNYFLIYATRL